MKKKYLFIFFSLILFILSACSSSSGEALKKEENQQNHSVTLRIGASSTPHAEILEFIKPTLKKEGINLDIQTITDGIQTNENTANGELDANFFQHTPFLKQTNKDSGLNLVKVEGIHIEPFGVYSKKVNSIKSLKKGASIALPNDPVNFSRALELFDANQIIELDKGDAQNKQFTLEDIKKNPQELEFIKVDGPLLPRSLDDADAAAINTNYALEAKLNPKEDALIIEDDHSPYVNILVSRQDNKANDSIQKLAKALTTEEVKTFINEHYKGAVVPVF
ncbi:MetQ/NlpA family ABC transporter substrate-binding protein [Priestia filamentosa]|uniref:MetQ/NlpA family ABC transporter substrate-binding protein n=1 Tax=Priestia filamentosa TaxID=1402861 RepID=UPI001FB3AACC|nr:MetQ/NlpA family ABC transporter substrate-binding protein [Priestia filamentosa]MED3725983.1 MetQ/NlpA family ABC transporter substrate-binding protein [Priestia filamentosa]UOE62076.1 MetQ/NlpA family ABC transporter substrate-binding protein [Priestia filamentosa]